MQAVIQKWGNTSLHPIVLAITMDYKSLTPPPNHVALTYSPCGIII